MKQVQEMPKEGQFVAVYSGGTKEIWSDTFKWKEGKLLIYRDFGFHIEADPTWDHLSEDVIFYIKESQ